MVTFRFFLIFSIVLLCSREAHVEEKKPKISLEVQTDFIFLPEAQMQDISFQMIFKNEGSVPVSIYPRVAQFSAASGWGSPYWELVARIPGYPSPIILKELRNYYGPPDSPPLPSYFHQASEILNPGAVAKYRLSGCWLPRSQLPFKHEFVKSHDPQGMDGLKEIDTSGPVLVFDQTCNEVKQSMVKRIDFLRPGMILFLPSSYTQFLLSFSYHQKEWGEFFIPREQLSLKAPDIALKSSSHATGLIHVAEIGLKLKQLHREDHRRLEVMEELGVALSRPPYFQRQDVIYWMGKPDEVTLPSNPNHQTILKNMLSDWAFRNGTSDRAQELLKRKNQLGILDYKLGKSSGGYASLHFIYDLRKGDRILLSQVFYTYPE